MYNLAELQKQERVYFVVQSALIEADFQAAELKICIRAKYLTIFSSRGK
jgi:hypothetical protein